VLGSALLISAVLSASGAGAPPDPSPTKPECIVSDVDANARPAAATLAVELRRAIFAELQQVVSRAQREAAAAYPSVEGGAMLAPTDVQKTGKVANKREAMALSLERSYLPDVLKRRDLTCAAARDIMREGRASRWPAEKLEEKSKK
jgi:hypothetical protein